MREIEVLFIEDDFESVSGKVSSTIEISERNGVYWSDGEDEDQDDDASLQPKMKRHKIEPPRNMGF